MPGEAKGVAKQLREHLPDALSHAPAIPAMVHGKVPRPAAMLVKVVKIAKAPAAPPEPSTVMAPGIAKDIGAIQKPFEEAGSELTLEV